MFTTSCFIRKNTPELREALRCMGRNYVPNGIREWNIPIDKCEYLVCDSDTLGGKPFSYHYGVLCKPNTGIDCGTNEPLFLALAALRDDTDRGQYFFAAEDGVARLCKSDRFEEECAMAELYHKMSVEELISYFEEQNLPIATIRFNPISKFHTECPSCCEINPLGANELHKLNEERKIILPCTKCGAHFKIVNR